MNSKSSFIKHLDFLFLDEICIIISLMLAYYIRHNSFDLFNNDIYKRMILFLLIINLLIYFFIEPFKDVLKRGYLEEFKQTSRIVLLNMLCSVLYLFAIQGGAAYSRITLLLTYVLYFLTSYTTRILYKKHMYNKAILSADDGDKSLLVICEYEDMDKIKKTISDNNFSFYQLNGFCVIDKNINDEVGKILSIDNLLNFISTKWVDDIFIACNYDKIPDPIKKGIIDSGILVSIRIDELDVFKGKQKVVATLGEYSVLTSYSRTDDYSRLFIKRVMDIFGGIIGCLITAVLIIIIGPIIYLKSPGPIIYVSDRVGKNGKIFKFYKFRSMVIDADDMKEQLKTNNRVKDGYMFKLDNDPRIIPGIGHFIRKTSLDEFPQFFNVLKGEMSLVGTRPPTLDEWNKYTPYYRSRLAMKPGITGLWQVSGRSNITDFDEVVRLDNEYINNWSISLDIKIIFKTILHIFNKDTGAL